MSVQKQKTVSGVYVLYLGMAAKPLYAVFTQSQVVEVYRHLSVTPLGGEFHFLQGVTNIYGTQVPVVSPVALFGLPTEEKVIAQYIAIRSATVHPHTGKNMQVVLTSDGKLQSASRMSLGLDALTAPVSFPGGLSNVSLINATYETEEHVIMVIDVDQLVQKLATIEQLYIPSGETVAA
ncbi:chemotaxis protein CheW [Desulfogranum japonicum]|uniref:chemotaxis protein CheW n=1 Tax=Desulfogranum japonicum TaxID=231447 RepID=UPI000400EF36|nr:chemotaxis protein CheW [Desulfogranum japonicum]